MRKPLAIDLYCGLGGWAEGLLAEGYDVIGFDIERHVYGEARYPAQLVLQDVLTLDGAQFKDAALIVASPPCQKYSYMAMPWKRAKALAAWYREDPARIADLNALFDACFRIQREASIAAGRRIPLIVENVRGAEPWCGPARWHFGSFYLWGDLPGLMPLALRRAVKVASIGGGRRTDIGKGARFTSRDCGLEGTKNGGDWFGSGADRSAQRRAYSSSPARKAAAAAIAKIPLPLAQHIAAVYKPREREAAA